MSDVIDRLCLLYFNKRVFDCLITNNWLKDGKPDYNALASTKGYLSNLSLADHYMLIAKMRMKIIMEMDVDTLRRLDNVVRKDFLSSLTEDDIIESIRGL